MICILQRVSHAKVEINRETVGEIESGLMVLCGFEPEDSYENLQKMAHKLLHYRIFADDQGKMNLNLQQVAGKLLLVPQFTLAADTSKGLRPGFHTGASPALAEKLFNDFVNLVSHLHERPETGKFGADMQVTLTNDGPVTFRLKI